MPLSPLGGSLVNRIVDSAHRSILEKEAASLTSVTLTPRADSDLELIAVGALSPLTGFMTQAQVEAVSRTLRLPLPNGSAVPFSVPVTLSVDEATAAKIAAGDKVALRDAKGRLRAVLTVTEKWKRDLSVEIPAVYGTSEDAHPGVALLRKEGPYLLAGPVDVIEANPEPEFATYRLTPAQTRAAFAAKKWTTVTAFQTRNPIHRAHEYLTKVALEMTDGLLVHPVVGETKSDDIPADVRLACYKALLDGYYNAERAMLSVLPLAMRYAGPREAVLHAIIRRNYGATHFIVGRDHAGVGNYYGTYDAQLIFDQFDPAEIGIVPLKFEHTFWCKKSGAMASPKTTNSAPEDRVALSGTKVREMLRAGQRPPVEFTRPEVADILIKWAQSLPA
jgi:sulfate adenylyltransferase